MLQKPLRPLAENFLSSDETVFEHSLEKMHLGDIVELNPIPLFLVGVHLNTLNKCF
jgi:hypothetical protein